MDLSALHQVDSSLSERWRQEEPMVTTEYFDNFSEMLVTALHAIAGFRTISAATNVNISSACLLKYVWYVCNQLKPLASL